MGKEIDVHETAKMAVEIVVAYLGSGDRSIEPENLPDLVRQVRSALVGDLAGPDLLPNAIPASPAMADAETMAPDLTDTSPRRLRPAVPAEESVHPNYLVSLENGRHFRSLRRHLMAKYGLTPDQYRAKWDLPPDYPMVAPNYAQERSEIAKRTGLGRNRAPEAVSTAARRGSKAGQR